MSEDLPDFLSDEPSSAPVTPQEAPAPAPEPAAQPAAEPAPATPPAPGEPPAQPAPPAHPPEPHAPLAALLDEREKRQAAEREAKELREWRQQQEAQARRQPIPDREEDPEGFEAFRESQVQISRFVERREIGRDVAEIKHGADAVRAMEEYATRRCDQDPTFNQRLIGSLRPWELIHSEWKQSQILEKISDPSEVEAFLAWRAAQAGQQPGQPQAPAAPAAPPARPAAPRASLAAAPSAGAVADAVPRDGGDQFQSMFGS